MSLLLPICFKYTGPVMGKGFLAHIELSGLLTASMEAEGTWLNGVQPGALAVGAPTLAEANVAARDVLTKTFIDFAQEAADFNAFKAMVEDYFNATDADRGEFDAAVERIKNGTAPVPDDIRRCPDPEVYVRVTLRKLEELTPQDNPMVHRENTESFAVPEYADVA